LKKPSQVNAENQISGSAVTFSGFVETDIFCAARHYFKDLRSLKMANSCIMENKLPFLRKSPGVASDRPTVAGNSAAQETVQALGW